jgi:hypothetical protein
MNERMLMVDKFQEMNSNPEHKKLMIEVVETFHHTKPVEDYLNMDSEPVLWRLLIVAYRFNEHHKALEAAYIRAAKWPDKKQDELRFAQHCKDLLKRSFMYDMDQIRVWPDFVNGLNYSASDETFLIGIIGSLYRMMKNDWVNLERRLNM